MARGRAFDLDGLGNGPRGGRGRGRSTRGRGGTIHPPSSSAEKYGREPTPIEVFTYTHTKDHDCHTFVDRSALGVNVSNNEEYLHLPSSHFLCVQVQYNKACNYID
ncbi:hypothetical protein JCGZ_10995 [Jatropha curcas]|uniref:Uncharacterized protein n=1 Tax=Jatropha curcas TaxID=180498 RepID=A0A067KFS7_JATCU|nr:hypothetical protein JCGZ_10995 [Jatropha curcas]